MAALFRRRERRRAVAGSYACANEGARQGIDPGVPQARTIPSAEWVGAEPSVLVFDVNETLLDFESMAPLFQRVFGDRRVLREWLGPLIGRTPVSA